jgi:hypothetical protein
MLIPLDMDQKDLEEYVCDACENDMSSGKDEPERIRKQNHANRLILQKAYETARVSVVKKCEDELNNLEKLYQMTLRKLDRREVGDGSRMTLPELIAAINVDEKFEEEVHQTVVRQRTLHSDKLRTERRIQMYKEARKKGYITKKQEKQGIQGTGNNYTCNCVCTDNKIDLDAHL